MTSIKKIVILGGESTGKSTLCIQLARHYKTAWVPEYAREYLEKLNRHYEEHDLLEIAKGQLLLEEKQINYANRFLFCDTDLHVLKIWSEFKYKRCDPFILEKLALQKYDAYIITAPDFPWEADPLREHPALHLRDYFFQLYSDAVIKTKLPYCTVKGNEDERMKIAVSFLEGL